MDRGGWWRQAPSLSRRALLQRAAAGTFVLGAGSLLAACGDDDDEEPATSAAAATSEPAGSAASDAATTGGAATSATTAAAEAPAGTVRTALYGAPEEVEFYQSLIDQFEAANPQITIELETTVYEEFAKKMDLAFASDSPPDVVYAFSQNFAGWAPRGLFQPIDDLIERDADQVRLDDYLPRFPDLFNVDGKQYGLPDNASTIVLFYRPSEFERAGLEDPNALAERGEWTWDAFVDAATKLTRADDKFWGVQRPWTTYMILASFGAKAVSDDGTTCLIDSPEAREALEFLTSWETSLNISPPASVVAGLGDAFTVKRVAMTIDGYWRVFALRGAEDTDFDVVPVPTGPAGPVTRMASNALCITANTQVRDAAWEFVKFFQSPETRLAVAKRGASIPPQSSAARSPEFLLPDTPPAHASVFLDVAQYAQPDPLVPYFDEMSALINSKLEEVYAGSSSVDAIIPELKQGIDEMIQRSA